MFGSSKGDAEIGGGPPGLVAVTAAVTPEVAAALEALAKQAGAADVAQYAGQVLTQAVWDEDESLIPDSAPPMARLAHGLMALAVREEADEMVLRPVEKGVRLAFRRAGGDIVPSSGLPHVLPLRMRRPLFERFERMAGAPLRRTAAEAEVEAGYFFDERPVDVLIGYAPDLEAEGGESLRLRFRYSPESEDAPGSSP
jgi:hypothetical protein